MELRNSESEPLRIDVVSALPGEIGLTICPGKQGPTMTHGIWHRDIDTDLAVIRAWHPSMIIGLMEDFEYKFLHTATMPTRARELGMQYKNIAIKDGGIPCGSALRQWDSLKADIHAALDNSGRILVHCRGGLGRSGTLAAMMLIERGMEAERAIRQVRERRTGAIETVGQERFLRAPVCKVRAIIPRHNPQNAG